MNVKNRIGVKVAQIRESREISRQELAERSELKTELIDRIGEKVFAVEPLFGIVLPKGGYVNGLGHA